MKSKLVRSFAMVCAAAVLVGCVNRADRDNESRAGSVADGENVSVVDAGENGEETSKINPDKASFDPDKFFPTLGTPFLKHYSPL